MEDFHQPSSFSHRTRHLRHLSFLQHMPPQLAQLSSLQSRISDRPATVIRRTKRSESPFRPIHGSFIVSFVYGGMGRWLILEDDRFRFQNMASFGLGCWGRTEAASSSDGSTTFQLHPLFSVATSRLRSQDASLDFPAARGYILPRRLVERETSESAKGVGRLGGLLGSVCWLVISWKIPVPNHPKTHCSVPSGRSSPSPGLLPRTSAAAAALSPAPCPPPSGRHGAAGGHGHGSPTSVVTHVARRS